MLAGVLGRLLDEEAGERPAVIKRDESPQNRDDDGYAQTHAEQKQVVAEDVEDDRAKNREPQRNIAVRQQQRASSDFQNTNNEP